MDIPENPHRLRYAATDGWPERRQIQGRPCAEQVPIMLQIATIEKERA
jgi:hypothetical protein